MTDLIANSLQSFKKSKTILYEGNEFTQQLPSICLKIHILICYLVSTNIYCFFSFQLAEQSNGEVKGDALGVICEERKGGRQRR